MLDLMTCHVNAEHENLFFTKFFMDRWTQSLIA